MCQNCQQKAATVHLTEIVDSVKREIHLCEPCAQEKGVAIKAQIQDVDFPDFFGQLAESGPEQSKNQNVAKTQMKCETCGLTFEAFRNSGKFGCANDYSAFKEGLLGLLNRIHGSTQHRGKVPTRASGKISRQKELREMEEELKLAVESEAYEKAAELRDKIHSIKTQPSSASADTDEQVPEVEKESMND